MTYTNDVARSSDGIVLYDYRKIIITNLPDGLETSIQINNAPNFSEMAPKDTLYWICYLIKYQHRNHKRFDNPIKLVDFINNNINKIPDDYDCAVFSYVFLRNFPSADLYSTRINNDTDWHFVISYNGKFYQKNKGSIIFVDDNKDSAFRFQTNIKLLNNNNRIAISNNKNLSLNDLEFTRHTMNNETQLCEEGILNHLCIMENKAKMMLY